MQMMKPTNQHPVTGGRASSSEPKPSGRPGKSQSRLVTAGFIAVVISFFVPPLFPIPIVIGIILIVRGRVGVAAAIIGMGFIAPLIGAVLLMSLTVKTYRVASESMEPTLALDQRFIVNRVVYRLRDPSRRDIIVLHAPTGFDRTNQCGVSHSRKSPCPKSTGQQSKVSFIQRIIGLPGDRISVIDGIAVINGKPLKEPYINPCGDLPACNLPKAIKIQPGHYFAMGDNRGAADDSRFWGPIPKDWIIGEVLFTYWPPNKIGTP